MQHIIGRSARLLHAGVEIAMLACSVAAIEKAEAEKVQVVKGAEADAEAKYLQVCANASISLQFAGLMA